MHKYSRTGGVFWSVCTQNLRENQYAVTSRLCYSGHLQFSPAVEIQRGYYECLCVCVHHTLCNKGYLVPIIPLTHYSQELLLGCNVTPFTAAPCHDPPDCEGPTKKPLGGKSTSKSLMLVSEATGLYNAMHCSIIQCRV